MKGMNAFQKINDIHPNFIQEAELPALVVSEKPPRHQSALGKFLSSGAFVAILCGVVSFTVTFLIVMAGRNPNLPSGTPTDTHDTPIIETEIESPAEADVTLPSEPESEPPEETEKVTEKVTEKATEKVTEKATEKVTKPVETEPPIVPVESIILPQEVYALNVGDILVLEAEVLPDDATDKRIMWQSSNTTIVEIDEKSGQLTALRKGEATIMVKTLSGGISASCKITVDDVIYPANATQGLQYVWRGDYYEWSGMGESKEKHVVLPELVNGRPLQTIDLTYQSLNTVGVLSVTMSSSVERIKSQGFVSSSTLQSVTFVGDIVLENQAFQSCSNLTTVNGWEHITEMQAAAFSHCAALTSVTIYPHTTYGTYPFQGTGVTEVTFEPGVTAIAQNLFSSCAKLTSIQIPDTVTSIGGGAFASTGLTDIQIPASVTTIGAYAFNGTDLVSVTLPDGLKSVSANLFYECRSLESVYIPASVEVIGGNAFTYCEKLTQVNLSAGLRSLGAGAFSSCTALREVSIPDSVTEIGNSCFGFCASLTSVKLPAGLTRLEDYTFRSCESLTKIDLPDTLTYIGDMAFSKAGIVAIHIPDSVAVIDNSAFAYNPNLQSVTFGESSQLTHVYDNVFCECTGLTSVIFPDSLTYLGSNAFRLCSSLEDVYLSQNLTYLGTLAFSYCTALEHIYLPKSLSGMTYSSTLVSPFNNCRDDLVVYTGMIQSPTYISRPITVKIGYSYEQYRDEVEAQT